MSGEKTLMFSNDRSECRGMGQHISDHVHSPNTGGQYEHDVKSRYVTAATVPIQVYWSICLNSVQGIFLHIACSWVKLLMGQMIGCMSVISPK